MIHPPGAFPGDRAPEYPLFPMVAMSYEERHDGTILMRAWAVGTNGSRCTREYSLDRHVALAYPEFVTSTARHLCEAVKLELQAADLWDTRLACDEFVTPNRRENASQP